MRQRSNREEEEAAEFCIREEEGKKKITNKKNTMNMITLFGSAECGLSVVYLSVLRHTAARVGMVQTVFPRGGFISYFLFFMSDSPGEPSHFINKYLHIYISTYLHIYIHTYIYMSIHLSIHTHIYISYLLGIYLYIHVCIYVYTTYTITYLSIYRLNIAAGSNLWGLSEVLTD